MAGYVPPEARKPIYRFAGILFVLLGIYLLYTNSVNYIPVTAKVIASGAQSTYCGGGRLGPSYACTEYMITYTYKWNNVSSGNVTIFATQNETATYPVGSNIPVLVNKNNYAPGQLNQGFLMDNLVEIIMVGIGVVLLLVSFRGGRVSER